MGDAANLPSTKEFALPSTCIEVLLAWSKWQLIKAIQLDHVLNVLIVPLLFPCVTARVVEIRSELGLRLFGVGERFAPGVVDLIVPATSKPPADFRLQSMVVRPPTATDVVSNEGVLIGRQEELRTKGRGVGSNPKVGKTTLDRVLNKVRAAAVEIVRCQLSNLTLFNQSQDSAVGEISTLAEFREDC